MRFMLGMKNTGVATEIHMRLSSNVDSNLLIASALVSLARCVRIRNASAIICMNAGRSASGKNVPLNRSIESILEVEVMACLFQGAPFEAELFLKSWSLRLVGARLSWLCT